MIWVVFIVVLIASCSVAFLYGYLIGGRKTAKAIVSRMPREQAEQVLDGLLGEIKEMAAGHGRRS